MRRARLLRACVLAAVLLALALGVGWWLRRSPVEFVAWLPAGWTTEARGRWLVLHQTHPSTIGASQTATWVMPTPAGPVRLLDGPPDVVPSRPAATTCEEVVYFTSRGSGSAPGLGLYRAPLDGSQGAMLASGIHTASVRDECVVAGGDAYWLNVRGAGSPTIGTATQAGPVASSLWAVPLRGGHARALLTARARWCFLGPADTGLVWTQRPPPGASGGTASTARPSFHHYRLADGRHTVWRDTSGLRSWMGLVELGGRYYTLQDALPDALQQRKSLGPRLLSWALDGSECRQVVAMPGARHTRALWPRQIMQYRHRLYMLQGWERDGLWTLSEVRLRPDGATLRPFATLPQNPGYHAYCDSGYCYIEAQADQQQGGRSRARLWLDRLLSGDPKPALYRVRLPE